MKHFYRVNIFRVLTILQQVISDVYTAWELGLGPCGPNCSTSSVGKESSRAYMLHRDGQGYYGGWSAEIGYSSGERRRPNLTAQINSHIHEHVVDVNIQSGWEMSEMVVKAILPEEPNTTITYVDFM